MRVIHKPRMGKSRTAFADWVGRAWAFTDDSPATALAFGVCAALMGRIALIQLRCLSLPIVFEEQHNWRQGFTYSVAWNFAHSNADFFHPRWYTEGAKNNLVAMEAPIYPYLGSLAMRVFGDGVFCLRLLSWLSLVATAVILFIWLGKDRRRDGEAWADRAGLFLAVGLSISLGSDYRSVQPDALSAGFALGAAYFFARHAQAPRVRDLAIAAGLTSLAVLTKPSALGIVPGLALFGAWRREGWLRHGGLVIGAAAIAVVPHLLWDRWALHLLKESGGIVIISIQHDTSAMLTHLKNPFYAREAILQLLPSYASSWWLVPAILGGVYRSVADPRLRRFGVPFLVWLAGYLVELIAFGDRLHSNYYYFALGPAPLASFAALGVGALIDVLSVPQPRPSIVTYRVALIAALAAAGPLFSTHANWGSVDAGEIGFQKNWRVWTDELGLAMLAAWILVAMTVAASVRKVRIPTWLGFALVAGFIGTSAPAAQSAWQFLRFYSAIEKRPSFAGVPELRAAVARHSAPEDRIIVSDNDVIWFDYARRNGFAQMNPTPAQLANLRPRGARLYVHMKPEPSHWPPGRLLESGASWHVYCVAEDDCPNH